MMTNPNEPSRTHIPDTSAIDPSPQDALAGESDPAAERQGLPQAAAFLAYAGALPLIIAALLVWLRPEDLGAGAVRFMLLYGTVLIPFFGGVRWGIAVMRKDGPSFAGLLGAVAPLLIALPLILFQNAALQFAIIIVALPALLWDDLRATRRGCGAPDWYLGVRTPLTILMTLSFIAAFIKTLLTSPLLGGA